MSPLLTLLLSELRYFLLYVATNFSRFETEVLRTHHSFRFFDIDANEWILCVEALLFILPFIDLLFTLPFFDRVMERQDGRWWYVKGCFDLFSMFWLFIIHVRTSIARSLAQSYDGFLYINANSRTSKSRFMLLLLHRADVKFIEVYPPTYAPS